MKLFLPLTTILIISILIAGAQGNAEFLSLPEDASIGQGESLTLQWSLANAEGWNYELTVSTEANGTLMAARGVVEQGMIQYEILSAPLGTLTFELTVTDGSGMLNDTVVVTVTENGGLDSTVETSVDTGNFPILAVVMILPLIVFRRNIKK
ncbi:MAG: hypothetical protein D6694_06220 [Gammaproteobacteria bacterium]|nr:MAG: hypothetical protein D6694_06220 [Gammaproteobacteria bacterium]